jgi:hypothetical protein
MSDLAAVISALGGAGITKLFNTGSEMFNGYCVGLLVGFFSYAAVRVISPEYFKELARMELSKKGNAEMGGNGINTAVGGDTAASSVTVTPSKTLEVKRP